MDNRRVLKNRMSALKDCEPWEMWSWGDFIETLGIDRSSNWEDTVDRVCRLIGGDPEREKAADWVEVNGGLDSVQERMGLFADMLNRIDSIVCGDEQHCFDERIDLGEADELFGVICDALGKRLMPLGMEWPRFEDGGKANVGDYILHDGKSERVQGVYFYKNSVTLSLVGVDHEKLHTIKYGERAKRTEPEVLGADGLPIEAGQTVYSENGNRLVVAEVDTDRATVEFDGKPKRGWIASLLTHTPPDTQERIDDDATMPPRGYYAKHIGHDVGLKDDAECTEAMVRHLLNRQRGLDAKTMGGE